jgi:hypothetical protein
LVVPENLLVGSVVERRQLRTALRDLAELVTQPPSPGPTSQSGQTLPERDHDGGGERLAGARRHFPGKPVSLGIFEAQSHLILTSRCRVTMSCEHATNVVSVRQSVSRIIPDV